MFDAPRLPYDPSLPVAVHVSRREAGRHLNRINEASVELHCVLAGIADFAGARFSRGRRLEETGVRATEETVVASLEAMQPFLTRRVSKTSVMRKPPTAREVLSIVPDYVEMDGFNACHLAGVRVYVDRKRAVIDRERLGVAISRHLMERAMERDLVGRESGFDTVEQALFMAQGIVVAWSQAVRMGLARPDRDLHLPFGDGLLLGTSYASTQAQFVRFRIDGVGFFPRAEITQGLRSLPPSDGNPTNLEWLGRTAVSEDLLSLEQVDYRDEMLSFCARWSELLLRIAENGAWTGPQLMEPLTLDAIEGELALAARELADIVQAPRYDRVYASKVEHDAGFLTKLSKQMTQRASLFAWLSYNAAVDKQNSVRCAGGSRSSI